MGRALTTLFGIIAVTIIAGACTEASAVIAGHQSTSPEKAVTSPPAKKAASPAVLSPRSPVPAPVPTQPATIAPQTPSAPQPTTPTATVISYVHLRAAPSTAAAILFDLYQGDVVSYTTVDASLWQAVTYNGQAGYVYKAYLTY